MDIKNSKKLYDVPGIREQHIKQHIQNVNEDLIISLLNKDQNKHY